MKISIFGSLYKKSGPFLLFLIVYTLLPLTGFPLPQEEVEPVVSIPVETILKGNSVSKTVKVWTEMINNAKKSIDIAEFYLISKKNGPLEPVILSLMNASARGVKIRFLIEKKMLNISTPVMKRFGPFENISFTIFDWSDLNGGIIHAKYFIVDDREVFVGSQNFDWRAMKHIHETGLRIRNSDIAIKLKSIFEADWKYCNGEKEIYKNMKRIDFIADKSDLYLTASPFEFNPPGIPDSLKVIKKMISGAAKKITIQLLNFKTGIYGSKNEFTELYDLLVEAGLRGVDIKVAVSDWNLKEPEVKAIKSLSKNRGITVKVFTIPEYSKGFIPYSRVIHSKVMRVDDSISVVGTSNWGYGYFYKSRNVEVVLNIKKIAVKLDGLFDELWNSGYGTVIDPGKKYIPPKTH